MRSGKANWTLIDGVLVTVVAAIVTAVAVPLIERGSQEATRSAALENLRGLRAQLELYRTEHGGRTPVVNNGTLPQLVRPTNAQGELGERGRRFPLGPYLQGGMPANPYTGRSIVTESAVFPFAATSGNGGWLYHPPTGSVALDVDGWFDQ